MRRLTKNLKPMENEQTGGALPLIAELDPSTESLVHPSSHIAIASAIASSPASPRKRQSRRYVDYRELLALESQARQISVCRIPTSARSLFHNPQNPQAYERALSSEANDGSMGIFEIPSPPENVPLLNPHQPAVVVVDQRMNMHFGSGRNFKSVIAAKAAALISWRMLASRKSVGAIIFNDQRIFQFRLGCNRLHILVILQMLVNQNHNLLPDAGICSNPGMLNDALRRVNKLPNNPVIFFITDASGHDQETIRLVSSISQSRDMVVALVYDPTQAKFSGGARPRSSDHRLFPDGVPVVPVNARGDLTPQIRRILTGSVLRPFAAVRQQQMSNFSTIAESL
ncbi:MAG TPA: hypothetical protein VHC44_16430 [Verrucomicrobiae bacterium]|nr:hypothetical protein [Verrucomicrobiae bacterium]